MDDESLYREAIALGEAGEFGQAARLYKRLVAKSTDPRHFIGYGVCLQRLGHWEQSIVQLERGVELKPHYCEPDARLFLAESYLQANQKARAIQQWRIVERMPPSIRAMRQPPRKQELSLNSMQRRRSVQQAPNPSIEQTSQRPLRALCAAAHVER